MNTPFDTKYKLALFLATAKGRDFAVGWANGVVRYHRRSHDIIDANGFEPGSVKYAASEAAVSYCRGMER